MTVRRVHAGTRGGSGGAVMLRFVGYLKALAVISSVRRGSVRRYVKGNDLERGGRDNRELEYRD